MDDAIKERGIVIWVLCVGRRVTEVVDSSCPASGFANGEVGGITVDVELHSNGGISDDRLWMRCKVSRDFGDFLDVWSVALGC